MPHRPDPHPYASTSTSSRVLHQSSPHRLYKLFANLSFHIVTAKLEDDLVRVYDCIDELGGRCVSAEEAWIVVTALKGRLRLERSLDKQWIESKPIVSIDFVFDTYQVALETAVSKSGALPTLPSRCKYLLSFVPQPPPSRASNRFIDDNDVNDDGDGRRPIKKRKLEVDNESREEDLETDDVIMYDSDIDLEDIPSLAALRPCPLKCINQEIVDAIKPIIEEREFEEAQQKNSNVLSYRRSLSIIKSVPRKLKSGNEALKLQGVGEKVANRIDEFLETGSIAECEEILSSERFTALRTFASVHTIGHHRAKELYDRYNCRTLEDVRVFFDRMDTEDEALRQKDKDKRRLRGGMKTAEVVEEWIKLKHELDTKIPRKEVEEITTSVMEHAEAFIPGCEYTICGGYRRGKTESNDVDIVLRPPQDGQDIGFLRAIYLRLSELGLVTHVLNVTHRDTTTPIRAAPANFDNLDKAFVIFKLPGTGRLHRRVDIISAPRDRYASAVLSWSGSAMFERDLKRFAQNERGYKFHAGLINISTGEEINLETERDIFRFLGLRYLPPELRNADG